MCYGTLYCQFSIAIAIQHLRPYILHERITCVMWWTLYSTGQSGKEISKEGNVVNQVRVYVEITLRVVLHSNVASSSRRLTWLWQLHPPQHCHEDLELQLAICSCHFWLQSWWSCHGGLLETIKHCHHTELPSFCHLFSLTLQSITCVTASTWNTGLHT